MRWRTAAAAGPAVLALALAGCTIGGRPGDPTQDNGVSQQVDETHRFDVDLAGAMPTREQLGLGPGATMTSFRADGDTPIAVTYRLAGDRTLTVPASAVTVTTTFLNTTDPRKPDERDDALLPPNEVAATQPFTTKDEARELLLAQAGVLGLDTAAVELWWSTAPAEPGPDVVLSKQYFAGSVRIGYVDVSVGVFVSDIAYLIWDLSWDPPVPGYTYGTDGVPRPTTS